MIEYLSDHLDKPSSPEKVVPWEKLTSKSRTTLYRAIERSDISIVEDLTGFSYGLLSRISIQELQDGRNVGPARAAELLEELVTIFRDLESESESSDRGVLGSQIISITSLQILAKLTVDEQIETYLERIGSTQLLTSEQRHKLLQDLVPSKNPFRRMMFGKQDHDAALAHLIDANLRLSFALAKRVCVDADIRARTIAGNLGLLAGITSFSDQPNIAFESHVMRNIREYIENLVGSFHLSYSDIVELMLDANEQEVAKLDEADEEVVEVTPFLNCSSFTELFEELGLELLKIPKLDDRALQMLKHRHHAFGEPGKTLDDLGREWGVTRERVRQIVDPFMRVKIQLGYEVPILEQAVQVMIDCEDEEEFKEAVESNPIFSNEEVSWGRLWGICRILSPNSLAEKVYAKNKIWEESFGPTSRISSSIKSDRSKFGLYDLKVVSKKYEINEAQAFRVISDVYPRSIRCGSLVLARTKNLDTMFENSIVKQLKVSSPLEVQELLKGLQRTSKYRGVPLIGSVTDLTSLINELAGDPANYLQASNGLLKAVEFQTLEKWLIQIFSEASIGILHSNDVVNFALREKRVNVSSLSVYLLNSSIMRSHGRALYSLVGTEVSKDQLDTYTQITRGASEASEVSYEMKDASTGILYVKPNLNVITSGIVFLPAGYKKLFEIYEFESFCACEALETIQVVKFTASGFWTGFTAMIRHGFAEHGMTKGSTLRFEFNFDKLIVRLLVD